MGVFGVDNFRECVRPAAQHRVTLKFIMAATKLEVPISQQLDNISEKLKYLTMDLLQLRQKNQSGELKPEVSVIIEQNG